MEDSIVKIEISFPTGVTLTNDDMRMLDNIAGEICDRYEAVNPGRIMWPFGCGSKMLCHPLALKDDEPIPFDHSVYVIECSEREDYDWPCAKCGIAQGDHEHCIIDPPAGNCQFEPAPPKKTPAPKPRGLVPAHVYQSAVNGRREMRQALRESREAEKRYAGVLGEIKNRVGSTKYGIDRDAADAIAEMIRAALTQGGE